MQLDTIEKLEAAYRVLQSGQGTPEQRAEIKAEMERLQPVISMGRTGEFDFGGKFSALPPEEQNMAIELWRKTATNNRARSLAKAPGVAKGIASVIPKVGQALADFVGWERGAKFFGDQQEEFAQNAAEMAVETRSYMLGRPLTKKETEQTVEDTATVARNTQLGYEVGLGLATGGLTVGGKGLISGISLGAVEGGIFGYLMPDAEGNSRQERVKDRLGDAKWGALLGGGAGVLTGGAATVRNLITKQIQKYSDNADEAFRIADSFDVPISLGQASESPVLKFAESQAQGQYAKNFFQGQADNLAQAISRKLKLGLPSIKADIGSEIATRQDAAFSSLDDLVSSMKARGQFAWRGAYKKAKQVHADEGLKADDVIMKDVNHLQATIQDIAEQLDTANSAKMGENLEQLFREVQLAAARGGATLDDVNSWWLKINAMADDPAKSKFVRDAGERSSAQIEALSGRLRRAMLRQVGNAPSNPTMDMLKAGREAWSANKKAIQDVMETALDPMGFGKNMTAESVRQALDGRKVSVGATRRLMDRIRRMPGGQSKIRQIRQVLFEDMVADAMGSSALARGSESGSLNIKKFISNFGATTKRSRLAGIISPMEELNAREGIVLAQRILNADAQKSGNVLTRLPAGAQEIAINVVSQDPGFMARLLAGAMARGRGADWLFHTREGIEILRSLQPGQYVQLPKVAASRNAGIALLTGYLNDGAANALEDQVAPLEQEQ